MLASLQRFITLSIIAAACGWLLYFGFNAPAMALAGVFSMTLGHAGFLAIEFMLAWQVNKDDPLPRPSWKDLCGAWLGEALVAPLVFCWRQPFRPDEVPDQLGPSAQVHGRRGMVFVHGFFCNRGLWTPWLRRLQASGHSFVAVSLEPVFGSIDAYAPCLDDAVRRVTQATGLTPVLVCHSMGGLAARAWLKQMNAESRVHHVVTIATPHHGTWLARFGQGRNARQMRPGSDWLGRVGGDLPADTATLFTCWHTNCDNIVFPASSATLAGAANRLVPGVAHVQLAFTARVMQETLAMLDETPYR